MKRTTRTLMGDMLQIANQLGIPHQILEHTTLNEKYSILASQVPASGRPNVQYFVIGYGGHTGVVSPDNVVFTTSVDHYSSDQSLYKGIPFVMRLPGNDLTAAQRANYRLRNLVTNQRDGLQYIAYWAKPLNMANVTVSAKKIVRDASGTQTSSDYVPDSSVLNPTAPGVSTNNVDQVVTSGTWLSAVAQLDLSLSPADCTELLNVAQILFGDLQYALVSEYGLVSGIDVVANGDTGQGPQIQYTEVLAAQITDFLTNRGSGADDNDQGIPVIVNYGANEPLLASTAVANATVVGS